MKVVMFDMDGVIVDSWKHVAPIVYDALRKIGITQFSSEKEIKALWEDNLYGTLKKLGLSDEQFIDFKQYVKAEKSKIDEPFEMYQGMKDILDVLDEKCTLCVITSGNTQWALDFLEQNGLAMFNHVLGADEGSSKVKKIHSIKEKYPGADYFYIGDTKGDMIEGKQAGVTTVAVLWGWHSKETLDAGNPDYVISKPEELLTLFTS